MKEYRVSISMTTIKHAEVTVEATDVFDAELKVIAMSKNQKITTWSDPEVLERNVQKVVLVEEVMKKPTPALYAKAAAEKAISYAPNMYPCSNCGFPVFEGYQCDTCRCTNPRG